VSNKRQAAFDVRFSSSSSVFMLPPPMLALSGQGITHVALLRGALRLNHNCMSRSPNPQLHVLAALMVLLALVVMDSGRRKESRFGDFAA
jgi:hypothetical protein